MFLCCGFESRASPMNPSPVNRRLAGQSMCIIENTCSIHPLAALFYHGWSAMAFVKQRFLEEDYDRH